MPHSQEEKNKHHFVPVVYLKRFCMQNGQLLAYRKDYPNRPKSRHPTQVGYEQHYYRQPAEGGGWDNNSLEDFLGRSVEDGWNRLVNFLLTRSPLTPDHYNKLAEFIAAQYARVPSTRNAFERLLSERLHHELRYNVATGRIKLPEPPEELARKVADSSTGDIVDQLCFSIDPHSSIHAIPSAMLEVEKIFNKSTFFIVHNTSSVPFVTSDNPVIWFDPTTPDDRLLPYVHAPAGHALLLFPVTPWLLVYGATGHDTEHWTHTELPSADSVQAINAMLCRFAHEYVFANSRQSEALVQAHAALSPTMRTHMVPGPGGMPVMFWHWVFGQRWSKPKWEDGEPEAKLQ
jgi:hypothetical protein